MGVKAQNVPGMSRFGAVDQGYVWRASNATWVGHVDSKQVRMRSDLSSEKIPVTFMESGKRWLWGEVQMPGTLGRHQVLGVEREGVKGLEVGPVTCVGLYRQSVEE